VEIPGATGGAPDRRLKAARVVPSPAAAADADASPVAEPAAPVLGAPLVEAPAAQPPVEAGLLAVPAPAPAPAPASALAPVPEPEDVVAPAVRVSLGLGEDPLLPLPSDDPITRDLLDAADRLLGDGVPAPRRPPEVR
jgi:hypothetical protein